jgi:deoxyadenosine/deoxycytidine kinase
MQSDEPTCNYARLLDTIKHLKIAIVGQIASGKTTLGKHYLCNQGPHNDVKFLKEDISESLLAAYIKNPKKLASEFQCLMFADSRRREELAVEMSRRYGPIFIERPALENTIFADHHIAIGNMDYEQQMFYTTLTYKYESKVDLYVYLYVPVAELIKRRFTRGVSAEAGYDEAYIQELDNRYFERLIYWIAARKPLIIVDWSNFTNGTNEINLLKEIANWDGKCPYFLNSPSRSKMDKFKPPEYYKSRTFQWQDYLEFKKNKDYESLNKFKHKLITTLIKSQQDPFWIHITVSDVEALTAFPH